MAQIKVVSFVQDNTKGKPNEDFVQIAEDGRFAVVADGVTRTRENGRYPKVTARLVSEAVCHILCDGYDQGIRSYHTHFKKANDGIALINRDQHIIAKEELLTTLAVSGYFDFEKEIGVNRFFYAFIGDCGMLVYDRDLFPIRMTPNPLAELESFRDGWGLPEENSMCMWRSILRNKSNERRMTHGGLTGEEEACQYIQLNYMDVEFGDTILLYTDGILPFVYEAEFRAHVQAYARLGEGYWPQIHRYLKTATEKLAANGVKNLDDDRAFVAFSYDE